MKSKKLWLGIGAVVLIVLCMGVAFLATQGKTDYYTQIDNRWVTEIDPHGAMNYEYNLDAYDETGKERDITFETSNLCKCYGVNMVVSHVNIHVQKGSIYGLLGRNGAGKTSIMKMMLGLTPITDGNITMFGMQFPANKAEILRRVGVMIETPGFYPNLTATENLQILSSLRDVTDKNAIQKSLELVGLPYKDKKMFSEYSLGMKQRLGIAASIVHDPELLILDEPTNGLDPIGIAEMRSFIRELCSTKGKTVLISSHILSEIAMLADDVGIIDRGVLLEEESLKELEKKNAKYVQFSVSDAGKAAQIIDGAFKIKSMKIVDKNTLYLYDMSFPVAMINRTLVEAGIDVSEAHLCENTLEDYFKKITGGEGIA